MNCTNCGAPLSEGQKFCENCGSPVQAAAPQPPVQEPVQNYEPTQPVQEPVRSYEPPQPVQNYAAAAAAPVAAGQMNPPQPSMNVPTPPPAESFSAPEAPAAPAAPAEQPAPEKGRKGGKSRKPLIILLIIAAVIIAAIVISKIVNPNPDPGPEPATDEPVFTVNTDEKFIEPAGDDFTELENVLAHIICDGMEYDYSSDSAADDALSIIMNRMDGGLCVFDYFYEDDDGKEYAFLDEDDGRHPNMSCCIYDEDKMDWIVKNVFATDAEHSSSCDNWFYEDGRYHEVFEATEGRNQDAEVVSRKAGENNVYTIDVKITVYDPYSDEDEDGNPTDEYTPLFSSDYTVNAALADVDGEKVWKIFRFKSKQSAPENTDEGLDYETLAKTVVDNESIWTSGYDGGPSQRFTFWDLDFDGVPELVCSETAGSGVFSYNKFYKIGDGTLTEISFGEEDGYGMDADLLEPTEEPVTPALVRNKETGELYYLVSDYGRSGWEDNWTSVGLFRVVDGIIDYTELYTVGNHYNSSEDWQNGDSEVSYWVYNEESDYDGYMDVTETLENDYEDLGLTYFVNTIPDYQESSSNGKTDMIASAIGAFGYDGAYD